MKGESTCRAFLTSPLATRAVPYYFHPGKLAADWAGTAGLLTEFITRVRALMDKCSAVAVPGVSASRPPLRLTVRVPSDLEFCSKVGLDVAGWLATGAVDTLATQPLHGPNANYGASCLFSISA